MEELLALGSDPFAVASNGDNVFHILVKVLFRSPSDILDCLSFLPVELADLQNNDNLTPLEVLEERIQEECYSGLSCDYGRLSYLLTNKDFLKGNLLITGESSIERNKLFKTVMKYQKQFYPQSIRISVWTDDESVIEALSSLRETEDIYINDLEDIFTLAVEALLFELSRKPNIFICACLSNVSERILTKFMNYVFPLRIASKLSSATLSKLVFEEEKAEKLNENSYMRRNKNGEVDIVQL